MSIQPPAHQQDRQPRHHHLVSRLGNAQSQTVKFSPRAVIQRKGGHQGSDEGHEQPGIALGSEIDPGTTERRNHPVPGVEEDQGLEGQGYRDRQYHSHQTRGHIAGEGAHPNNPISVEETPILLWGDGASNRNRVHGNDHHHLEQHGVRRVPLRGDKDEIEQQEESQHPAQLGKLMYRQSGHMRAARELESHLQELFVPGALGDIFGQHGLCNQHAALLEQHTRLGAKACQEALHRIRQRGLRFPGLHFTY